MSGQATIKQAHPLVPGLFCRDPRWTVLHGFGDVPMKDSARKPPRITLHGRLGHHRPLASLLWREPSVVGPFDKRLLWARPKFTRRRERLSRIKINKLKRRARLFMAQTGWPG